MIDESGNKGKDTALDIFEYLDYRSFMRDHFSALQQRNAKASQRWIAKRAGFKTPQLLSMIVSGRRNLTEERIGPLTDAMGLGHEESEYFRIMVKLGSTEDPKQREELLEHINVAFRTGLFSQLSDEGLEVFREWYLPALREMVQLKGFKEDPFWIAKSLGITPDAAIQGLALLEQKGFLARVRGKWVRTEPSYHSFSKISPLLLSRFHMQMIDKSVKAISLPRDQRYFEALTISVPQNLVPALVQLVQRFIREADALAESSEAREAIMQLNVQLFPLSNQAPDDR